MTGFDTPLLAAGFFITLSGQASDLNDLNGAWFDSLTMHGLFFRSSPSSSKD